MVYYEDSQCIEIQKKIPECEPFVDIEDIAWFRAYMKENSLILVVSKLK